MGISTSTGTLTTGQSRTFNLSPASAVTLTISPNVRVTITETPATVAATGLGGNASRVHEPRLPGTFTYGPYPMGGTVVVDVESNSGSSVAWVRSDSIIAETADGTQALVDGGGNSFYIPSNFLHRGSFPYTIPSQGGAGILASFGGKKRVMDFAGTPNQYVYRNGTMHTGDLQFGTRTTDTPANTAFGATESDIETGGAQPTLFTPVIENGVMSIAGGRFRQNASDGSIRVMHYADDALYSNCPRFQITSRSLPNQQRLVWKGVVQFGDDETPYFPYVSGKENNLFWQIKGGTGQPPIALVCKREANGTLTILVQRKLANATNAVHSVAIYTAASATGLLPNTPITIEVHCTLDWRSFDEGGKAFLSVLVNGTALTMTDDAGGVEGTCSVNCPSVFTDVDQLYVMIFGIYRYDYSSVKAPNPCAVTFYRSQTFV